MNENNELNDIILNKSGSANSNKKIILAVATLGVILIIVVMLMNSLSSSGTDNLPQAVLPPQPQTEVTDEAVQEPLFEEVEVVQEKDNSDENLEQIAQKLKQESVVEETQETTPLVKETPKTIKETPKPVKTAVKKPVLKQTTVHKATSTGAYYIQVGSFSKYEPNKKFLNSISNLGYNYEYHKVSKLNKVLVGPFKTQKEAKDARRVLRAKVEPGSFLIKL